MCFGRKFFPSKRRIVVLFLFAVVLGLISLCFNYEPVSLPASNKKWHRFQNNLLALRLAKQQLDLSDHEESQGKQYEYNKLKQDNVYGVFGENNATSVLKGHDTKSDRQDQTQYKKELNMETDLASQDERRPQDVDEERNPFKKLAPWQEELTISTVQPTTKLDSEWRLSPLDSPEESPTAILRNNAASLDSTKVTSKERIFKRKYTENAEREHEGSKTEATPHGRISPSPLPAETESSNRHKNTNDIHRQPSHDGPPRYQSQLLSVGQQSHHSSNTKQPHYLQTDAPNTLEDLAQKRHTTNVPRSQQLKNVQPKFQSQNTQERPQQIDYVKQSQDVSHKSENMPQKSQSPDTSKQNHSHDAEPNFQSQNTPERQQSPDVTRKQSQNASRRHQSQNESRRQKSQSASRTHQSQDTSRGQQSRNTLEIQQYQDASRRHQSQDASRSQQSKDTSRGQQSQETPRRENSHKTPRRRQSQDTPSKPQSQNAAETPRPQKRQPNKQQSQDAPQERQSRKKEIQRSAIERSPNKEAAENRCWPKQHVMFLKTHKTASSTVTNILNRFGDKHNLTFALPINKLNRFVWPARFQTWFVDRTLLSKKPDILCNHAVYARDNLERIMPEDTYYITILRHPMLHFESTFFYLEFPRFCNISGKNNYEKMRNFFRSPEMFLNRFIKIKPDGWLIKNGMTFDLGLPSNRSNDEEFVQEYIQRLEKEFGLVLIAENFDESLVMLKRDLCWSLEDVLYFKLMERRERTEELPSDIFNNVLEWNRADILLYSYFSRKFHERLQKEGADFHEEVEKLRQMNEDLMNRCLSDTFHRHAFKTGVQVQNYRVNSNLKDKERRNCCRIVRDEVSYIKYHRVKQNRKLQEKTRRLEPFNRC